MIEALSLPRKFLVPTTTAITVQRLQLIGWVVFAHGLAIAASYAVGIYLGWPNFVLVGLESMFVYGITLYLKLPTWWRWINAIFLPGIMLASMWHIPTGFYLLALGLLWGLQRNVIAHRVPLYLSNDIAINELAKIIQQHAPTHSRLHIVDLGCGTGSVVQTLANQLPEHHIQGLECAGLLWLIAKIRTAKTRNATVIYNNFWHYSLASSDIVYAFLSPEPMSALWEKACQEMKPGSLFISNSFIIPNQAPDRFVPLNNNRNNRLLVWIIK